MVTTAAASVDLSEPSAAVCPSLEGPVLAVLSATNRPLSARDVARLTRRGSFEGTRQALRRLTEHGLVRVQEAGNATLYHLNRSHLAAAAVDVLVNMRSALLARVTDAVARWDVSPVHASVFGSAARGDGDTSSDIDLFLVRPKDVAESDPAWRTQINRLSEQVFGWTGNHVGLAEVGETELRRVARTATGRNIRKDGITVAGQTAAEVFESAE